MENPPITSDRGADLSLATQGSLFTPNVIAMPARRPQPGKSSGSTRSRQPSKTPMTRNKPRVEGQGELEFLAPVQPKPRTLGTTVEATIFCEAPVATPMHRAVAAAVDWAMVAIGYVLMLAAYFLCGGQFEFNRLNLLIFAGGLMVAALSYGIFWTIAATESFGMQWAHLRLITFDGYVPDTRQRILRLAGSCLSIFTVLGALWALADEEGLGWQDHMSRTFPTAHELETRIFRRV